MEAISSTHLRAPDSRNRSAAGQKRSRAPAETNQLHKLLTFHKSLAFHKPDCVAPALFHHLQLLSYSLSLYREHHPEHHAHPRHRRRLRPAECRMRLAHPGLVAAAPNRRGPVEWHVKLSALAHGTRCDVLREMAAASKAKDGLAAPPTRRRSSHLACPLLPAPHAPCRRVRAPLLDLVLAHPPKALLSRRPRCQSCHSPPLFRPRSIARRSHGPQRRLPSRPQRSVKQRAHLLWNCSAGALLARWASLPTLRLRARRAR